MNPLWPDPLDFLKEVRNFDITSPRCQILAFSSDMLEALSRALVGTEAAICHAFHTLVFPSQTSPGFFMGPGATMPSGQSDSAKVNLIHRHFMSQNLVSLCVKGA